jgi:cytochrome c peroxidase
MRFLRNDPVYYAGAFKTPTLRNVALTAPYMHNGVFATLAGVVEHYNGGGMTLLGHNELNPLGLRADEKRQVEAFLETLTGGG